VNDASNAILVSVDESGFNQRPFKLYAYASKGCDVVLWAPSCTDNNSYSLLMAIGSDGRKNHAVKKGTTKADAFANFLLSFFSLSTCIYDRSKKTNDIAG